MGFSSIVQANVAAGKPVTTGLFNKVRTNLDDHETRINAVETGGGAKIVLFNEVVNLEYGRVGDIAHSLLTEAEFQKRYGPEWQLIKGQSLSGTDLASLYGGTAPDARGEFLRVLDNGRGFDSGRSIGSGQSHQIGEHSHKWHDIRSYVGGSRPNLSATVAGGSYVEYGNFDSSGNFFAYANPLDQDRYTDKISVGSTEVRPENTAVNTFIKQNDDVFNYARIFRAPAGMNVISATISSLIAGSSGNLEVDILKGSSLGSMSTMLNSNISLAFGSGNYATSSEGDFSSTALAQNDFLRVDIKSMQVGQNEFYLNLYGESN